MFCDNCGSKLEDNQIFCPNCGNKIIIEKRCPYCGSTLNDDDIFCAVCGNRVQADAEFKQQEQNFEVASSDNVNPLDNVNSSDKINLSDKKESSGVLKVLLIVLSITAALSVIGVFVAVNMINDKENNSNELQVSSSVNSIPTQQPVTPSQTPMPIPTLTPTVYPSPVFSKIDVSSTRGVDKTEGVNHYFKEYAVDGKNDTAWTPEKADSDPTPWIQLSSDTPQYVTGVRISNGYFKSQRIYENNKIITKFLVEYEGGQKIYSCGTDQYGIMQNIIFDSPALTRYVKVTVLETYPGKQWDDIAISEISVY